MVSAVSEIGAASLYWSIIDVLISFFVGRAILKWQKRRDRLHFLQQRWHEQQLVNIHQLSDPTGLEVFERIVYGPDHKFDLKTSLRYHQLFLVLNMVQSHFFAMTHKIISRREFETYAMPSLQLICRERNTVIYLLAQRGYPADFKAEIERLFGKVSPSVPPSTSQA